MGWLTEDKYSDGKLVCLCKKNGSLKLRMLAVYPWD